MTGHPTWTQDNVVSLALVGRVANNAIVNVLHFQQVSGTQDPAGAAAFCDALAADFNTNVRAPYLAIHGADYTLDVIRTQPVAVSGLAHVTLASHDLVPTTTAGSFGQNSGGLAQAVEFKLKTLEGGKSHRGRIYVGPVPASVDIAGQWNDNTFNANVAAFITAMGRYLGAGAFVATGILVVFSRPLHVGGQQWAIRVGGNLVVRSNAAARVGDATPVTLVQADKIIRSQRRRELGVGA